MPKARQAEGPASSCATNLPRPGARRSPPDQKIVGSTVSWSIHRIAIAHVAQGHGAGLTTD